MDMSDTRAIAAEAAGDIPGVSVARGDDQFPLETSQSLGARVGVGLLRLVTRAGITVGVIVVIVLLWWAIVEVFSLPSTELPPPGSVWADLHGQWGVIWAQATPTIIESIIGFVISAALGVPLGYVISRPGPFARALNTGAVALQIFPKIAVAPLFLVWFGFGYAPRVLFIVLMSFFPIALNSAAGFASVPLDLHDLGSIVGMGPLSRIRKLQGPWALPQIFTGLKLAASFAVIAALVSEFSGGTQGLGVLIVQLEANLDISLMFAAILVVTVLGFVFYGLVSLLEMVAIPWHVSRRHR
jgi:NitT/TauT family transport system permease protein